MKCSEFVTRILVLLSYVFFILFQVTLTLKPPLPMQVVAHSKRLAEACDTFVAQTHDLVHECTELIAWTVKPITDNQKEVKILRYSHHCLVFYLPLGTPCDEKIIAMFLFCF